MDVHETTVANADLWSSYLRDRWAPPRSSASASAPSPVLDIADGVAATVSLLLSLTAAAPIGWLSRENALRTPPPAAVSARP